MPVPDHPGKGEEYVGLVVALQHRAQHVVIVVHLLIVELYIGIYPVEFVKYNLQCLKVIVRSDHSDLAAGLCIEGRLESGGGGFFRGFAAAKEIGTVEDFSKRPINYPRRDFEDKWNHPRAKTKIAFSSNAADNALQQEENQVHDDVEDNLFVQNFFKLLDPTDAKIVRLAMDGFTHKQIAEKLGFKTHSAVTKRLQKLRPVFAKYSRDRA